MKNLSEKILDVKFKLKLKHKDLKLLLEAYRRYMMFNSEKPLNVAWVGLGMPSQYKSEFFKSLSKEIPKANNWYLLTDKGIEIFKKILKEIPIPNDIQD